MSGNGPATRNKTDRRILRTRDTLGDALMELMQEKIFEEITVQQVLDRAGVGRSTFYTHYRDKEDLFLSDVEDFCESLPNILLRPGVSPLRVAPVEEFFGHVATARHVYEAFAASGKVQDVFEIVHGTLARSIQKRLQSAGVQMEGPLLAAYAHGLSGTLTSMLEWWIHHGMMPAPKQMDEMFHRIVWNGLGSTVPIP